MPNPFKLFWQTKRFPGIIVYSCFFPKHKNTHVYPYFECVFFGGVSWVRGRPRGESENRRIAWGTLKKSKHKILVRDRGLSWSHRHGNPKVVSGKADQRTKGEIRRNMIAVPCNRRTLETVIDWRMKSIVKNLSTIFQLILGCFGGGACCSKQNWEVAEIFQGQTKLEAVLTQSNYSQCGIFLNGV